MATRAGTIKKTPLSEFRNPRKAGIIAVTLDEGDELVKVLLTDGNKEVVMVSKKGKPSASLKKTSDLWAELQEVFVG